MPLAMPPRSFVGEWEWDDDAQPTNKLLTADFIEEEQASFASSRHTALTGDQLLLLQGMPSDKLLFAKQTQRGGARTVEGSSEGDIV